MASVSDHVHGTAIGTKVDPAKEVSSQPENKPDSTSPFFAARLPLQNLRLWAISGAVVVTMVAIVGIAAFNKEARIDQQQVRTMGLQTPPNEAESRLDGPLLSQSVSDRPRPLRDSTANKDTTGASRGSLPNAYGQTPNSPVPLIARTAALTILVKDSASARASLDAILAKYGGYSASLTIDTPENGQRHFQASLRIPENRLTPALNDLRTLGRALNETQSGEEVTNQHADLVARLQNSRETEQRLRLILEQRTGKIEDVLQVEQEIARVRGEIESMESEREALEHRVSFASVDLQLVEEYKEQLNSSPVSISSRLRNAFIEGIRNAAGTLLGLIFFLEEFAPSILMWFAIFGLPAYFVLRRFKRIRMGS